MMLVEILRQVNSASHLDPAGQPLRRGCDPDVAASLESIFRLIASPEEQRELCRELERIHPADARKICFRMTSNTRTILTMTSIMGWIVTLTCMVVLTPLFIMYRMIWNLCMNCMDQITVGSIVSCGMKSDHKDILHQRTVSFPVA